MTQTTNAMYGIDVKLEMSVNGGSTWADFSGQSNAIDPGSGGPRDKSAFYTFDGDKAITKVGKRTPADITIRVAYTENDAELFEMAHGCYENKTLVMFRWTMLPTSVFRWKTDAGQIYECPPPAGSADKPDIVPIEFKFWSPGIEEETVSGSPSV